MHYHHPAINDQNGQLMRQSMNEQKNTPLRIVTRERCCCAMRGARLIPAG